MAVVPNYIKTSTHTHITAFETNKYLIVANDTKIGTFWICNTKELCHTEMPTWTKCFTPWKKQETALCSIYDIHMNFTEDSWIRLCEGDL